MAHVNGNITQHTDFLDPAAAFHALIEGVREGAAILSADATILTCNRRLAEMLKRECEQVMGRPMLPFLIPEDQPRLEELLRSEPAEFKRLLVKLSGSNAFPLPVELALMTLTVGDARVFSLLATDLSRRRRAEEQLAFQAHLLANVSDAVAAMDEQYRITFWNAAAERLYGYTADEVIGRPAMNVVGLQLGEMERAQALRQLVETGRLENQGVHHRRDGTSILVESTTAALHTGEGRLIGYVSVGRDITEHKRAEEQLAFHAGILSRVHDAIVATDEQLRITYWSPIAEEVFGWTVEEARGRFSDDLLQTQVPESTREQAVRQLLEQGHYEGEVRYRRKDGMYIVAHARSATLKGAQGEFKGLVTSVRDVTERRQAEEETRRAKERYARLFDAVRDGFAHYRAIYAGDQLVDLVVVEINPTGAELSGKNREDQVGKTWRQVWPDVNENLFRLYQQVDATGEPVRFEDDNQLTGRWYDVLISRVAPGEFVVTFTDITQRKRAEQSLEAALQQARGHAARAEALTRAAALLNAQLDLPTLLQTICQEAARAVHASGAWINLYNPEREVLEFAVSFGLPADFGAQYRSPARVLYDEYAARVNPLVFPDVQVLRDIPNAELYAALDVRTIANATLLRDHELIGVLSVPIFGAIRAFTEDELALLRGLADQAAQAIANAHLLAQVQQNAVELEQRVAERTVELEHSKRRVTEILASIQDGFFTLDREWRLTYVNERATRVIGASPEDLIGQNLWERFPGLLGTAAETYYRRAMAERVSVQFEAQGIITDSFYDIHVYPSAEGISVYWVDISEHKRAEQALRESEDRYRVLFDSSPLPKWVLARETFAFLQVNDAAVQHYGYTRQEFLRLTLQDIRPPEEFPKFKAWLQGRDTQGEPLGWSATKHRKKDGTLIDVEAHYVEILYRNRRALLAVIVDTTERKRAELRLSQLNHALEARTRELDAERARWQGVVEGIADEVWVCDAAGRMGLINLPEVTHMGLPEFQDKSVAQVYEQVDILNLDGQMRPMEDAPLLRSLRGEVVRGEEIMRHRQTGTTRYRQFSSAPVRDAAGQITGAVAIVRDITEAKHAEQRLVQQQQTNQTLLNAVSNLGNGVALADDQARLVYVNEAFCRIVGYTAEELRAIPSTWALIPPEDRARLQARYQQRVRGEPVPEDVDLTLIRKDGSRVAVELAIKPLPKSDGIQFIIIARDITARKQSEQRIQQLNHDLERRAAELETANKELESFSYSVSHDLRTPLAAIDVFSSALIADYGPHLPTDGQHYLGFIRENAVAMGKLIQGLLEFSRLGRQPLQKQEVTMGDLVRQALATLEREQQGRQIEIVIGDLPNAQADPLLLKQVWANLLSNALKFTRTREVARIEIGSKSQVSSPMSPVASSAFAGGESETRDVKPVAGEPSASSGQALRPATVYYVRDNGVGFDPAERNKLFGVFRRLHADDEFEGHGVGLALVERIVRRHGGRVWAEGQVGEGATFYFTLA